MGSVIENEKTKEKCQTFTPDDIVKTMLDHVGYIDSLYGKTILENSCGNGQFLKEIVKRYINDCKQKGLSRTKIKNGLGRDIFGIELDPLLHQDSYIGFTRLFDDADFFALLQGVNAGPDDRFIARESGCDDCIPFRIYTVEDNVAFVDGRVIADHPDERVFVFMEYGAQRECISRTVDFREDSHLDIHSGGQLFRWLFGESEPHTVELVSVGFGREAEQGHRKVLI